MNKKKYASAFIWNMMGMGISSTLSLILLIFVTRLNGIEESGSFSFIFSLCLIVYTITLFGGRVYQVSDIKDEFTYNEYYSSKILTSFISLIVLLTYLLLNSFTTLELLIALLLMFTKILDAFSDTIYGTFQSNNRLDLVGKSLTYKTLISLIGFIIVDVFTSNLILSVFVYSLLNLIVFIIYDKRLEKKYEKLQLCLDKNIIKILISTKYIFLNNFITNILVNIPRFVVRSLYSKTELGYFGILIMIPTVLSLLGQFVVQPILLPLTYAYRDKDEKRFVKYIRISIFSIGCLSLLCAFIGYTLGPTVLKILYNIDFESYRLAIVLLILGGMFNVFSFFISTSLNIFRKTGMQTLIYFITLLLSALLSYILALNFSDKEIFVAYFLTMVLQYFMLYAYYTYVRKKSFE